MGGRKDREKVEGLAWTKQTGTAGMQTANWLVRHALRRRYITVVGVCVSMDNELPLLLGCLLPLMSYRFCFLLCTPRRKTHYSSSLVPRNAKRPLPPPRLYITAGVEKRIRIGV